MDIQKKEEEIRRVAKQSERLKEKEQSIVEGVIKQKGKGREEDKSIETNVGKRKRMEGEGVCERVDDQLAQLRLVRDEVNIFLFNDSNKVTRNAISFIL